MSQVVLITGCSTGIGRDLAQRLTHSGYAVPASPYQTLYQLSERFTADMRQQESGPEAVSRVIQQAMEASRPKPRYLVAVPFSGRLVLHLGDSVWDFVLRRMFKIAAAAE